MSSSSQQSFEVRVEIAVQPPSMVGVNRWLIPPIVARTNDPQLVEDVMNHTRTIYATAMLTSSTGEDYTSILNGNWNVTAQLVVNSSSGGGGSSSRHSGDEWLYFIFNPVSIGMAGEYTFSLIVSAMNLVNRTSVVVGGKSTRQVTVVNRAVAPTRPSSSERHVLRRLEAEGLYSPGGMGQ